jgi:predicted metal-dependent phosphoesterase TrpH
MGLAALAITDHDTLEGVQQALTNGIPPPLKFISGLEISTAPPPHFPFKGSFHILGYGIALDHAPLNGVLEKLQLARQNRNPGIVKRLAEMGMPIGFKELSEATGGTGQIGRPHIAQVMVAKGYVTSIDEAFDRFIGAGKPAYVDKFRVDCSEAIRLILSAGGVPVLAHPYLYRHYGDSKLETLIKTLIQMGLQGLEAYYPEHSGEDTQRFTSLADHYGLLQTGGTDFHGTIKKGLQLGNGNGNFCVPYRLFERLMERLS